MTPAAWSRCGVFVGHVVWVGVGVCLPLSLSVCRSGCVLVCARAGTYMRACTCACMHACVRVRVCVRVCNVPLLNLVCTHASPVRCYAARDTWAWLGVVLLARSLTTPTPVTSAPGLDPRLHRDCRPFHICAGTGLEPPTSAPELGSALRVCARTGLEPPTSAPELGSPLRVCAETGLTPPTSAPELGMCCSQREA